MLVTNFTNVRYLTGFTGDDSYLLVLPEGAVLLSDRRYTIQLQEECPWLDVQIRSPKTQMIEVVEKASSSPNTDVASAANLAIRRLHGRHP